MTSSRTSQRAKTTARRLALGVATTAIFVYFAFPLFWVFLTSIKPKKYAYDPGKWIFRPSFEGYTEALRDYNIPHLALNSAIVAAFTVVIALAFGTLAAYSLARFQYKMRKPTFFLFLSVRFIPPLALVLPLFLLGRTLHLLDTRFILVAAYQLLTITFTILMMKGFIQGIPKEFEEAATLEGCSQIQAFLLVTLPLVRGGMFATAVFLFLYSWNEFPYALFLSTFKSRTLPTGVEYFLGTQGVNWSGAMAYGFMSVLPVLAAAILFRRYMVQGLTFGVGGSE